MGVVVAVLHALAVERSDFQGPRFQGPRVACSYPGDMDPVRDDELMM